MLVMKVDNHWKKTVKEKISSTSLTRAKIPCLSLDIR